jgi:hypothetical protein
MWIRGSDSKLLLSRSTDGGENFSDTTVWQWPNGLGTSGGLQLAIDPSESLYAAWSASTGAQPSNVFFTRSTDAGHSFSTPVTLASGSSPWLALDSSGAIDLAWQNSAILFSRSTDHGASFSSPATVASSGEMPQVTMDSKDDIFVLWRGSSGLLFSRSLDGGATFTAAQSPGNLMIGNSSMVIDSGGNINVVGDAGIRGAAQIFDARSIDAGNTFMATQISNDTQMLCPDNPRLALESSGTVDVVWEQYLNAPFGSTGIPGCDANANQVLFSRGVVTQSDFTISAAPAAQVVLPGGTAKFDPTLRATTGFRDAVNLSCTSLPPGAECFFDAATITPKESGTQTTLTVTVAPTNAQGNERFTLVATGGDVQHTMDMHLAVVSITGSVTPLSATIGVGNSSNFNVSLTSGNGSNVQLTLASKVTLECSGAPAGVDCSFSPAETVVPGTAILTVHVASKPVVAGVSTGLQGNRPVLEDLGLILIMAGIVFFSLQERKESFIAALSRLRASSELWLATAVPGIAATVILITLAMSMVSCGGKTSGSTITSGTSFTTTNTGSSGGVGGNGGTGGTGGFGGSGTSGGGSGAGSSGGSAGGGISGANPPVTFPVTVLGQSGGTTVVLGTISITVP